MRAKDVYDKLASFSSVPEVTTCDLQARCNQARQCGTPQTECVVDFDRVKTLWNVAHRQSSMSSVDALAYHNDALCFIEIKGTVNFVTFQIDPNKSDSENLQVIRQQMQAYTSSLQKKFIDSFTICQGITGDVQFNNGIRLIYVLTTDVALSPLANLANQLSVLASSSSNWNMIYATALGNAFHAATVNLTGISTKYSSCNEIDTFVRSL